LHQLGAARSRATPIHFLECDLSAQASIDLEIAAPNRQGPPVKRDTISRFNRNTIWLATGVLGTVAFSALVLAFQECQPKAPQTEKDLLLNANPSRARSVLARSSSSGDKKTAGLGSGDELGFAETSLPEIPSSNMEPAASPPGLVLASPPEISHNALRQNSARERISRTHNVKNRSSVGFGTADVKRRLIELWHKSLARSAKSRSWTAFFELEQGGK
jgi:hypothetical protein